MKVKILFCEYWYTSSKTGKILYKLHFKLNDSSAYTCFVVSDHAVAQGSEITLHLSRDFEGKCVVTIA